MLEMDSDRIDSCFRRNDSKNRIIQKSRYIIIVQALFKIQATNLRIRNETNTWEFGRFSFMEDNYLLYFS